MATRKKAARAKRKPAGKASRRAKAVPAGYQTVTPHLVQDDCAKAIEFYKVAFGAKELFRMPGPDGKIAHAEIRVGTSRVMMSDEMQSMGQPGVYKSPKAAGLNTAALFLYVAGVDKWFDRAVKAGCTVRSPLTDMFWGDRYGQVIDPFGHTWGMATHLEDLTPKQMAARQKEAFGG
jgi:PhnB protein